mmetsp:Transcript_2310/g.5463  ORF Transcript_2310/g.5463 Transcript_2310/m.5463 type:complete len:300 (-) Transcript_2310:42-941(-)
METRQPPRKKNRSSRPQPAPGKARIAMLETYKAVAASWPPDMNRLLSSTLDAERRAELWELMAESGDRLRREYAWALPDERALRVLEAYAPLVEVGAGKGYWASLLHARGVDVVAFDAKPPPKCYFDVKVGGPEVCSSLSDRSLFLCYPDDACRADLDDKEDSSKSDSEEDPGSLALACLRAYEGEAIVVVGESVCSGGTLSLAQAPWGRSCDSLFQVELAQSFHPVLVAALPRWPLSRDCIVVWLRTRVCPVVFEKESDDDSETDAMLWGDIPESEILAADCAAPCARHLLVKPPTYA